MRDGASVERDDDDREVGIDCVEGDVFVRLGSGVLGFLFLPAAADACEEDGVTCSETFSASFFVPAEVVLPLEKLALGGRGSFGGAGFLMGGCGLGGVMLFITAAGFGGGVGEGVGAGTGMSVSVLLSAVDLLSDFESTL